MRALATVLADPNPIHLDPEAARARGLGTRVVNQGPANCAYVMNMLAAALPTATLRELRVRMLAPVCAGDEVVAAGRVTTVDHDADGGGRLTCQVWLDVVGGPRSLEGTAVLGLTADERTG